MGKNVIIAVFSILLLVNYVFAIKIGGNVGIGGSKYIEKNVIIKIQPPTVPTSVTVTTAIPTTTATQTTVPKNGTNAFVKTGIGCGTTLMKSGDVFRITSNNYNVSGGPSTYFNNDACTWKLIGKECVVTAECPCVDIVPSFDCLEDYLKIIIPPIYHQKFCGTVTPQGAYRASHEALAIRFRTNKRDVATGFVCYVQCTGPGQPDQMIPTQMCPKL